MRIQARSHVLVGTALFVATAALASSSAPVGYSTAGSEVLDPVWPGSQVTAANDPVQVFLSGRTTVVVEPRSSAEFSLDAEALLIKVLDGSVSLAGDPDTRWQAGATVALGGGGDVAQTVEPAVLTSAVDEGATLLNVDSTGGIDEDLAVLLRGADGAEVHCIASISETTIELADGLGVSLDEGAEVVQGQEVAEAVESGDAEDRTGGDCDLAAIVADDGRRGRIALIGLGAAGAGIAISVVEDDDREPSTTIETRADGN
ncbi:MAG: hypothetical protein DWQ36_09770 [Acidobacteria bacterium]|nr:MAG: hypothetical protein DWQ30_01050 [Acidobacteriota bacterium]REK08348.1 MAG: hypothetical protein DWQ36_09770 [Acidobacteriota bacterium]